MMKKQYIILLMALLCLFNQLAVAQLLPVNFPSNKVACDATPWKLVVFDDFNGNALNTTKWFPFNTNNWDDHDNWCGARLGYPGNYTIHRDENVIVNNGTLKLTVEQKTKAFYFVDFLLISIIKMPANSVFTGILYLSNVVGT